MYSSPSSIPQAPLHNLNPMLEELQNLPILLQQFDTYRIRELVQLKHLYLLRWAWFAVGQPKITDELHTDFQQRIE